MGQLFLKIKYFCSFITQLLLDNGKGRATPVEGTSGPGDPSGFSVFISQILKNIGNALLNIGEFLLSCLAQLGYFIAKIAMNIMDLMNVVIKQLVGQATNYSGLGSNSSLEETDILFQFLFNEVTMRILRDVFIFAFILLIIFTIIAIVKQEWENHINGKQNSVKKIFRKVIISIFSLIIVPFIVIVGIVFSNVVLSSAMSALSGDGGSYSLGAQIFSSSSYEANRYRVYATDGKKIPIVFDYDGGFENAVSTEIPTLSEESSAKQESELKNMKTSGNFTTGQATYNMFVDEVFYEFKTIQDQSSYYDIYDGPYLKTKQIEYYAMADFLDFAMTSGGTFYLTNTEDVFDEVMNYISINGLPDSEEDKTSYDMIFSVLDSILAFNEKGEPVFDANNTDDIEGFAEKYVSGEEVIDHFEFTTYYNAFRADVLVTDGISENGTIAYTSVAGSTDEVTGAKYLFCHKVTMNEDGDYLLLPVKLGDNINNIKFTSNFLEEAPLSEDKKTTIREETVFVARGLFTTYGYPTAIRQEGNEIVFYRQDPISPSAVNYSEIFNYQENNGGQTADGGSNFVTDTVEFLSGVDISTLVPDIQVNLNFLRVFTKEEVSATSLDGGKFSVNYSFVGSNLKMAHLYDELKINFVVLLFAVVSMFMSFYHIIWGLIKRLFEITLLWVTMPGWIAKFPIDKADQIGGDGTAFKNWKDRMIERVMALYAIYLAVALVLLLIPIVFQFDFITTFDIPETNIFGIFNADIANLVIKTAFILVLLNFLNIGNSKGPASAPRLIENIILWSKGDPGKGYLTDVGEGVLGDVKKFKNQASHFIPVVGQAKLIKGAALNVSREAVSWIPGRNIADRLLDHGRGQKNFEKRNDEMLANAQSDLLGATTEADVEAKAKELQSATSDHTYMEGFRQASKDYWRSTGDGDKDFRDRGSGGERISKIATKGGGVKVKDGKKKRTERSMYRKTRKKRNI